MKQSVRARLATIIKNLHPEIFNEAVAISEPKLSDTTAVSGLYEYYLGNHPLLLDSKSGKGRADAQHLHRLVFIAAILDLYCPSALYGSCIVTGGIRSLLANEFGYNSRQSVSELMSRARAYIKQPTFRANVMMLVEEFMEFTSSQKAVQHPGYVN